MRPHLWPIFDAWQALRGDRAMGQGCVGHIPWSSINAYAQRYGITDIDRFERLETLIQRMDDVYVEHVMGLLKAD